MLASVVSRAGRRPEVIAGVQVRTIRFAVAALAPALAGAALTDAAPTGGGPVDKVWAAALIGAVAYLAGTARRWTWFPAAGVAAALSGEAWATVAAALAIGLAAWSVVTDTRTRVRGALVGGLGAAALLGAGAVGFHGLTAILTALAVVPAAVSGYRNAGRRIRARIRRAAAILGAAVAMMVGGAVLAVVSVHGDLTEGARMIDEGLAAARDTDDDLAGQQLSRAARHLTSAESTLSGWFVAPARLLPVVSQNINAVDSLAERAADAASVASSAADTADVGSLRFIDGRLDPEAVAAMEVPLTRSVAAVEGLSETIDDAGASPWLVAPLADRLDILDNQVGEVIPDGQAALEAIRNAPWLLGAEDGPRRYLVLFVTPVEARGRSGFPGNFAELVVDDGQLSMTRFGRVSELEQGGVPGEMRTLTFPPDYVERYARFDPASTWRNITMSPDFPSVAAVATQLYPQSGGAPVDGVISIDPLGLAELLRYTGPVEVEGLPTPLDADNAAQFLLFDQYLQYGDVAQRIDVLETVARTTFERLTTVDFPGPRQVAEAFDPLVDGGHIQFAASHAPTLDWLDGIGLSGRLPEVRGDALAVTTNNAGGSKIDLFLQRWLRYDVAWDPVTGQVDGTITLALTNQAPPSGLPDYVIGNSIEGMPPGTNRSFVSVYTPHRLAGARIDGRPASFGAETEQGRNVYSTFVELAPGQTMTIELDVQGSVAPSLYVLDLAQQPLARPEQAEVNVEVAGGLPMAGRLAPDDHGTFGTEGRTVSWAGPLDRQVTLAAAAAEELPELLDRMGAG